MRPVHTGGCLCGAVRYEIDGHLRNITHCHCGMCRKSHGAAFATYALVPRRRFRLTSGAPLVRAYRSSEKARREFCGTCGSHLFWSGDDLPDAVAVTLGTLHGDPRSRPQAHIFVKDRAGWYEINDSLPQFDEGLPQAMTPTKTSAHKVLDSTDASVGDGELGHLIREVYVGGGFTDPDVAARFFTAAAIRRRGRLLFVRDPADGALLGTVIVVEPGAPACRVATDGEAEMQLLAVTPHRRNRGLGAALIDAAVQSAKRDGYPQMVLRTQPTMLAAHRAYERAGFVRAPQRDMEDGGRAFLVYYKPL